MNYIWILLIILIVLFEIIAIAVVSNEDILYTFEDRVKRIAFIICVPIIGAIIELRELDKYARYKKDSNGKDIIIYSFWEYYASSNIFSDSGSSDGDSGGGSD